MNKTLLTLSLLCAGALYAANEAPVAPVVEEIAAPVAAPVEQEQTPVEVKEEAVAAVEEELPVEDLALPVEDMAAEQAPATPEAEEVK